MISSHEPRLFIIRKGVYPSQQGLPRRELANKDERTKKQTILYSPTRH